MNDTFTGNANGTKVISEKVTDFGSPAARIYQQNFRFIESTDALQWFKRYKFAEVFQYKPLP